MVIPHATDSKIPNDTYSDDNGHYPYTIGYFPRAENLSEVPCIFDLLRYLQKEYGFVGFYRAGKTFKEKYGKGMVRSRHTLDVHVFNEFVPQEIKEGIHGIVFFDSQDSPPKHVTDEEGKQQSYFKYLPNLYINAGELLLEIPEVVKLEKDYEKKDWNNLAKIVEARLQNCKN